MPSNTGRRFIDSQLRLASARHPGFWVSGSCWASASSERTGRPPCSSSPSQQSATGCGGGVWHWTSEAVSRYSAGRRWLPTQTTNTTSGRTGTRAGFTGCIRQPSSTYAQRGHAFMSWPPCWTAEDKSR